MSNTKLTVLNAPAGKWYTQAKEVSDENRIFTKTIYLGKADKASNWKLVGDSVKEATEESLKSE